MVVKKMIKTIRVMLIPNNKQNTKLFRYANTARFAYNWALGREKENYKNGGKFLSDSDLRKEFTQLKKTEEYSCLLYTSILPDCSGLRTAVSVFQPSLQIHNKRSHNHPHRLGA